MGEENSLTMNWGKEEKRVCIFKASSNSPKYFENDQLQLNCRWKKFRMKLNELTNEDEIGKTAHFSENVLCNCESSVLASN